MNCLNCGAPHVGAFKCGFCGTMPISEVKRQPPVKNQGHKPRRAKKIASKEEIRAEISQRTLMFENAVPNTKKFPAPPEPANYIEPAEFVKRLNEIVPFEEKILWVLHWGACFYSLTNKRVIADYYSTGFFSNRMIPFELKQFYFTNDTTLDIKAIQFLWEDTDTVACTIKNRTKSIEISMNKSHVPDFKKIMDKIVL